MGRDLFDDSVDDLEDDYLDGLEDENSELASNEDLEFIGSEELGIDYHAIKPRNESQSQNEQTHPEDTTYMAPVKMTVSRGKLSSKMKNKHGIKAILIQKKNGKKHILV